MTDNGGRLPICKLCVCGYLEGKIVCLQCHDKTVKELQTQIENLKEKTEGKQ